MNARKKEKIRQLQSDYQKVVEEKEKLVLRRRLGLMRRLTVFGVFASLIAYFIFSTFYSQYEAIEQKEKQKDQLTEELQQLEKAKVRLEEEIVMLNNDEYIAKIARRDYFLSEDNEIIFSVPDDFVSY